MRRRPLDEEAYLRRARATCFVCALVAGDPDYRHHVVYEDERAIAFLSAYATLYGTVLVDDVVPVLRVAGDERADEAGRAGAAAVGLLVERPAPHGP